MSYNCICQWWLPHQEAFGAAFVDTFPHFGMTTTSTVEGSHSVVKGYLKLGTMNLDTVLNRLQLVLASQFTELKTDLARQTAMIKHRHSVALLKPLLQQVSQWALDRMYGQLKHLKRWDLGNCSGHFRASFGLPCKHELKRHLLDRTTVELDNVHYQWHIVQREQADYDERLPATDDSPRKLILDQMNS